MRVISKHLHTAIQSQTDLLKAVADSAKKNSADPRMVAAFEKAAAPKK